METANISFSDHEALLEAVTQDADKKNSFLKKIIGSRIHNKAKLSDLKVIKNFSISEEICIDLLVICKLNFQGKSFYYAHLIDITNGAINFQSISHIYTCYRHLYSYIKINRRLRFFYCKNILLLKMHVLGTGPDWHENFNLVGQLLERDNLYIHYFSFNVNKGLDLDSYHACSPPDDTLDKNIEDAFDIWMNDFSKYRKAKKRR